MKRIVSIVGILVFLVATGACHNRTTGTKIDSDTLAKIKRGETTKDQVSALLGPPDSMFSQNGIDIYTYSYSNVQISGKSYIPFAGPFVGGSTSEHQTVMIRFDEKGIVQAVSSSQGSRDSHRGW